MAVPTYTLPFATVGTVNFTAFPAWSDPLLVLFHNSVARLVASCACKIAPVMGFGRSMVHTMPFVDPCEDIDGVAPGNAYVPDDWELGVVVNIPLGFSARL